MATQVEFGRQAEPFGVEVKSWRMQVQETAQLDPSYCVKDEHEVAAAYGIQGRVLAVLNASGYDFSLIDVRKEPTFSVNYALFQEHYDPQNPISLGCLGIRYGLEYTVGRKHYAEEFEYSDSVSRNHFMIGYNDSGLLITNLSETNPTLITAPIVIHDELPEPEPVNNDSRTSLVNERMMHHPAYRPPDANAPYGYLYDHPIIGRFSTTINNGVNLGAGQREAIVVDGDSEALQWVYEPLKKRFAETARQGHTLLPKDVLIQIKNRVQQTMPTNPEKVERICAPYSDDQLVGLSFFVKKRAGVCRQHSLMSAFLIEQSINDGFISGQVAVERNDSREGAHGWATLDLGRLVYVVDATHNFVGTKQESLDQGGWNYFLSTDRR